MPRYSVADAMNDPFAVPLARADFQQDYLDRIEEGPVWRHSGRVVLFRFEDIVAIKSLVERVGSDQLRTLIDVMGK